MEKKQGNIKVFCRFRPFNKAQLLSHSQQLHRISKNTQLIIKDIKGEKVEEISFMFDHAFDMGSTQQQVFEKVGLPVLQNILDGFNGTIMAYGQTSSGKTHTMQGYQVSEKQNRGIMPRIIERLFAAIQKSTDSIEYKLKISIFQLYMQKIRDLLDVSKSDLKVRENKTGAYIENLTQVYVGDKAEIFKLVHLGQKNRITCSTNMNEHSSRSHMIFMLSLNQFNSVDSSSKTSKLYLIDLAGSEKIAKTGAEGKVLQEAKKINLSLTNLGKVIKNLAQKNGHIPYRDSKLTRVLKDSLGGNSKTTLLVTCSPHEMHLPETISTLRFGENAQKIKNKPKINRQLTVQQLQKIVEKMQGDIKLKDAKIECLQRYVKEKLNAQLPDYAKEISGLLIQAQKVQQPAVKEQPQPQKQTMNIEQQPQPQQKIQPTASSQQVIPPTQPSSPTTNEQTAYYTQRIAQMEEQLSKANLNLSKQTQKYYQLKKQYTELHENLTSILKENIELQQLKALVDKDKADLEQRVNQLQYAIAMKEQAKRQHQQQEKQHLNNNQIKQKPASQQAENASTLSQYETQLENQLLENNSTLIKMILGQIFSILGPYQEQQIIKVIQNDHWYKKIVQDGVGCVDFYEYEKERMNNEIETFIKQKQIFEKGIKSEVSTDNATQSSKTQDQKYEALVEQFFAQKQRQNDKIITLQNKLDKLFDEYHQMISLQTSWKAECQLYERKLKKKEEKIQELQETLQQLSEQIEYLQGNTYDDFEDSRSVKSKIVKPLKGGFFFK